MTNVEAGFRAALMPRTPKTNFLTDGRHFYPLVKTRGNGRIRAVLLGLLSFWATLQFGILAIHAIMQ